ncbi:uncharacterized protein AB675_11216, partial [Cyphellophora attinorum]
EVAAKRPPTHHHLSGERSERFPGRAAREDGETGFIEWSPGKAPNGPSARSQPSSVGAAKYTFRQREPSDPTQENAEPPRRGRRIIYGAVVPLKGILFDAPNLHNGHAGQQRATTRKGGAGFDPKSPEVLEGFGDMLQSLKGLQRHVAETASNAPSQRAPPSSTASDRPDRPPPLESPVSKIVTDIFKEAQRPLKAPPPPEDITPLDQDPWAEMLATPVRLCAGSGARVPRGLMAEWSVVQDEEGDGNLWLLPAGLADVGKSEKDVALIEEKKRRKAAKKAASGGHLRPGSSGSMDAGDAVDAVAEAQEENGDFQYDEHNDVHPASPPDTDISNTRNSVLSSQSRHLSATRSRPLATHLVPHLNLIRQLTVELTLIPPPKAKKGASASSTTSDNTAPLQQAQLKTQHSAIRNLLPTHHKQKLDALGHFERMHGTAAGKKGAAKDQSAAPLTQSSEEEDQAIDAGDDLDKQLRADDVSGVQWDPLIAGRMVTILRERVIEGLKVVLREHVKHERDDSSVQRIAIIEGSLRSPSSWRPSLQDLKKAGLVLGPSRAALNDNAKDSLNAASAWEVGSGSAATPTTDNRPLLLGSKGEIHPRRPRVMLHLGSWPYQVLLDWSPSVAAAPILVEEEAGHDQRSKSLAETSAARSLVPPMLAGLGRSKPKVPYFPLLPMLGADGLMRVKAEVLRLLDPKSSPAEVGGAGDDGKGGGDAAFRRKHCIDIFPPKCANGDGGGFSFSAGRELSEAEAQLERIRALLTTPPSCPGSHNNHVHSSDGFNNLTTAAGNSGDDDDSLMFTDPFFPTQSEKAPTTTGPSPPPTHPEDKDSESITLLLRASTRYLPLLLPHLWMLWRYVGGRRCLELWEEGIDCADGRVVGDPRVEAMASPKENKG